MMSGRYYNRITRVCCRSVIDPPLELLHTESHYVFPGIEQTLPHA
jgi:hypothetical protein